MNVPFMVCHGADDKVTHPDGARLLYERAPAKDKTLKLYEGLRHEILNEKEKDQVLSDMIEWIHERLEAKHQQSEDRNRTHSAL